MFDPITASVTQIEANLWHLMNRHADTMEAGAEMSRIDSNDPDLKLLEADLETIDAQYNECELVLRCAVPVSYIYGE